MNARFATVGRLSRGRRSLSGSTLVEVTVALLILMGVAYTTCMDSTMCLNQAAYDARHAVASTYIANEATRVRAAFSTNDPSSYLTNYPSVLGETNSMTNVPLGGVTAMANAHCPYVGTVYRSLVSQVLGAQGLVYNRYEVNVKIPLVRGTTLTNEVLTRDIDRIFRQ